MIAAGDFKDPFPLGGKNIVISDEGCYYNFCQ